MLGVKITRLSSQHWIVYGRGRMGLRPAGQPLLLGESGTTFRLLAGVLAGYPFQSCLAASRALRGRPMRRISAPLRLMGAYISSRCVKSDAGLEEYPPLKIRGGNLRGIYFRSQVASAQVKSAVLLAGLFAQGPTTVYEPVPTRDHTERMLEAFGVEIVKRGHTVSVRGPAVLVSPGKIRVPGDISSASFFVALATLVANSCLLIREVSLNPTRLGFVRVLQRMGADIELRSAPGEHPEPQGKIRVRSAHLAATCVRASEVPSLIDELPLLMVVAVFCRGTTRIRGVGELRVKETDRIRSMVDNLRRMGAAIDSIPAKDEIAIRGTQRLKGARLAGFGDHRTVMSLAIAGLLAQGKSCISGADAVRKSFPEFVDKLSPLVPGRIKII
jgi:3-phosphoshikimate 1-carboxyvinyltransferase